MKKRIFIAPMTIILLAGCGTLKINVDYRNPQTPVRSESNSDSIGTPNAVSTWTSTPSRSPSPTRATVSGESTNPSSTESFSQVVAITVGYNHTCALFTPGKVKCWGLNDKGQLGDGSLINRTTPTEVEGLTGVTAIAAGGSHTCALSNGRVKCWGENLSGQLGDSTHADRAAPVEVTGLSNGVAAIAAGGGHTCALMDRGEVRCWGWNGSGQLGDGTNIDRSNPVPVDSAGVLFYAITAGYQHTCALTTSAGVKCWGENGSGQLGDGTHADRAVPGDVEGLRITVSSMSLGEAHTCAVMQDRAIQCWGDNRFGQLTDDTIRYSVFPKPVIELIGGVLEVSAGSGHTCALTEAGVECWGRNYFGQLGNGTKDSSFNPVKVVGFSLTAVAIATGGNHTCGLTAGGGVRCWGNNAFGQLGDGTTADRSTPVDAVGMNTAAMDDENAEPAA